MDNKYLVNIILPVYNAENTINRTLDSICKQTFKEFKVIIVNDCSTDNTKNIVFSYTNRLNITFIDLTKNLGVSNARNIGIENASSKYILFIDSDDAIDSHYIEHLMNVDEKKEFVITQYRRNTEDIKLNKVDDVSEIIIDDFKEDCWNSWNRYRITNVWGVRYKTQIIKDNQLKFDVNLKWGEDTKFNTDYLKYCNSLVSIPYLDYIYYINSDSISHKYEKDRFFNSLTVAKALSEFIGDSNQLWMIIYIYWDMAVRHCINHLDDFNSKKWKRSVYKDMKVAVNSNFFRTCIKDVIKNGTFDMKIYAFFLKIKFIKLYIFLIKRGYFK